MRRVVVAPLALVLVSSLVMSTAGVALPDDASVSPLERPGTAPMSTPGATAEPTPGPEGSQPRPLGSLGGTWRKMPRSPFAAVIPVAVWAGDEMVAIDHVSGRTATYDPPMRRWEEHQPLPHDPDTPSQVFEGVDWAVAAGGEVIALGSYTGPDDHWYEWYAFDPSRGRWREVATSPFERNAGDHSAWTGDLLLVVSRAGDAAAYDPAVDRWLEMPNAPGVPISSTHWTGEVLLAVTGGVGPGSRSGIVTFHLGSWTWETGALGPVDGDWVEPILAQGKLWFMTDEPDERFVANAIYDPASDSWTETDDDCLVETGEATWTGRLILEPYYDRRAFDPETGQCLHIPASKDRARHWVPVWTGRELIYWSGAYGDTSRAFRDGIIYRPPRSAVTDEQAKLIGKKLKRAIKARRSHGFDTDPDVVREIMRDPYCRTRGIPMTEAECRDINERTWFSIQLQEKVVPYVKRRPIKGGWWIDQRHGGRLAIALTEADSDVIARIDSLMPAEPDLGWRLVIAKRPLKELRTAQWRAPRVSEELDPTAKLWAWGVDVKNGVVTLMYDPDDVKRMRARKKQLEKRLGVPVRITSGQVRDL